MIIAIIFIIGILNLGTERGLSERIYHENYHTFVASHVFTARSLHVIENSFSYIYDKSLILED